MKKYELSHIQEAFSIPDPFFSEALGILPQSIAKNIRDEDLKILDIFWLGLVPSSMENIVKAHCNQTQFLRFTPNIPASKGFSNDCLSTWREIKDLIMAKAIGLHRIVGAISKKKEKYYRKEYNLVKGTYMDPVFREEMNRKRKAVTIYSQKTGQPKEVNSEEPNEAIEPPRKILCNGITCNKKNKRWCLDQKFVSNKIEPSKKHCLRCSRFSTSMKHSADILSSIGNNKNNKNLNTLQSTITQSAINGIPYRSMLNILSKRNILKIEIKFIKCRNYFIKI